MAITEEKGAIQKWSKQFIVRHDSFRPIWKKITLEEQYTVLEIIANGTGIMSYRNFVSQDSLDLSPESSIFFENWIS